MSRKKQVIFIMTDTQRTDMLGCYGNERMITPNLDRLAREGIRYDKAYTTQPVCQPARAAIFTGSYPHSCAGWSNCMGLSDNVPNIGQRLSDAGIHTAYVGKWHLDGGDYFGLGRCAKGWDEDYAESQVMNGGLTIYTTQDTSMQQILEEKYLNDSTFGDGGRENKAQSAMVIMDYNGNIKALIGGRGEKEGDRLFNRATMAVRRPGSSIKPISIYAPAVESNLIHYSSIVEDSPFPTIIDGVVREDWPANSYGRYLGNILIPEAIRRSTNTIPVKLVNQYTPQNSYNFLTQQLGFTTLVGTPDENGQTDISVAPLALGSLNKGMRLTELTAAYQIFNGEGIRTEAHTYTKVLDANGDILLEKNPDITHAISEETSTIMNRLLLNVIEGGEGATGTRAKISGVPIVGKTGTATNDQGQTTDQLFIGCTPDYVAGIWIGNDDNSKLGSYSPTAAWRNVMVDVLAGRSIGEFSFSDNVEAKEYCTETGLLAVDGCPKATGYYKKDNMPDYCSGNHAESQPAA